MSIPSSSSVESSDSPSVDIQPIATRLQDANEGKSIGNDYFRQSKWNEALVAYRHALNLLPKRKDPIRNTREDVDDEDGDQSSSADASKGDETSPTPNDKSTDGVVEKETTDPLTEEEEEEVAKLRSILHANIGACHVKLGEHKEAVDACTQGLKDDPKYVKALQRRAAANEMLGTWSSLTSAQEDYNTLLSLVQPASQKLDIEAKLRKLKPRVEEAQKKETAEMMGKLKGLGNSLLGNFGLSTDNFKFEPNGQGGYSMNFVR